MSKPKAIRERKADRKAAAEALKVQAALAAEAGAQAAEVAQAAAGPVRPPPPKLHTDDLMALATMDPEELAALMEDAVMAGAHEVGTKVTGTITRINDTTILVDIGAKSEAWLDSEELPDALIGEQVTAFVIHAGEASIRLSMKLSGDAAGAFIEEAHDAGIPVEGLVASSNSGGFEVRVGSVRAFCPRSLMSRSYFEEPELFVGQTLQFKVIETGDKIVLSRRALEEEQAAEFAAGFWQRVTEGETLTGLVRNIQPFGAFVDVGGVDGLIPRSELSWSHGASTSDLVNIGETVSVRVIAVDRDAKKLTLSLKNPEQEPWRKVGAEFIDGGIYSGTIARITAFGAFVNLADGLDGLIHISKLVGSPPSVGDAIQVRVLAVDESRQRISLAPFKEGESTEEEPEQVTGKVAEVMRNGVVVQLDDGRTGWLPEKEVELPAGTVLAQRYRRGKTVTARVVDSSRANRITLSTRSKSDDQDWRQAAAVAKKKEGNFGTLGDLFAGLKLK